MFNVYGIFCKTTWKVYYGSTEETIERRLSKHKSDYKSYLEGTGKYVSSYEVLKNNNYEIKLLEKCDNEIQMCNREDYYIITFPCVNKKRAGIPGRTKKEYYEANKEKKKEYDKKYREDNKEKIKEYDKKYREANREKILEKAKEYYEDNKEEILEKAKEYREANREKILEKAKETYTCACGSTLTIQYKAKHEKSIKHKKYLQSL